jgi:S-adenosylmethionine:tRNA ribosyltransferase-isomerase
LSFCVQDFDFELPTELIAQRPLDERSASRLLFAPCGQPLQDQSFSALLDWLQPNDLLVLNDTKVIPARLVGRKEGGGRKIEVFLFWFLLFQVLLLVLECKLGQYINYFFP